MRGWLGSRTTGDLLILMIAGTVCFAVLATGALLGILALTQPERDTTPAVSVIADVINTLIGLLAGFMAGRTDVLKMRAEAEIERSRHPTEEPE